jgi:hypothetical protein
VAHIEQELDDEPALKLSKNNHPLPKPKEVVTLSLATLEKAFSANIFFENFYFPLLRSRLSRGQ